MRTTLDIDEELLKNVTQLPGHQNKSKAVCEALREYVQEKKIEQLIALMGKVEIEEDWRKLRDGELGEER